MNKESLMSIGRKIAHSKPAEVIGGFLTIPRESTFPFQFSQGAIDGWVISSVLAGKLSMTTLLAGLLGSRITINSIYYGLRFMQGRKK